MRMHSATVLATLFVSGSAQAGFVGGGFVSLDAWNTAANATALPGAAGGAVTVYRMYAAFDGQDTEFDTVNSVFDVLLSAPAPIVNITAAFPTGDIFENPAVQWDSFATINVRNLTDDSGIAASPDGDGVNWGASLLTGGWFVAGSTQGLAGTNGGSDDFGTGLHLVMLAQITVLAADDPGDLIDIRSDGNFGDAGFLDGFNGFISLGINSQTDPAIHDIRIGIFPTPGPVALLGMAGLIATRRRRA